MAADHYMGRVPEFTHMSNGIGADWIAKHGRQTYDHDNIIINGKKAKVPRFYDTKYEVVDAKRLVAVKRLRVRKAKLRPEDLSNRRSWTRDKVIRARLNQRKRDYET